MPQLIAHLVGDYILQSHWMATRKMNEWLPAVLHTVLYTAPFIFLTQDVSKLLVICLSHLLIDRYRLANYVTRIKNWNWKTSTGYPDNTPDFLSVWLMIITDNILHITINYFILSI